MARGFLLTMTDDMGLEQFSPFGQGGNVGAGGLAYPTLTNIAGLATNGWRCSAWAQQLCSPTRATLLTGVYPFRHGVGELVRDDFNNPGTQDALPESFTTIAEAFLAAGYRTAAFGKWHTGNNTNGGKLSPQRAGFETFCGNLHNLTVSNPSDPAASLLGFSGGQTYTDWMRVSNGDTTRCRQFHATYLANLAIDWIRARKARDENWFLYLPWFNAHTPYPSTIPTNLYNTAAWGNPPSSDIRKFKALQEALDAELGRILAVLNYTDDTVVLTSDNGTGYSTLDDGVEHEAHPSNIPPEYLRYYTRADTYREYRGKDSPFETGVRVPIIVRGAGVTNTGANGGSMFSTADIMPTMLALAGITYPTQPRDGISFAPLLTGGSITGHDYIYTEWFTPTGANTGETSGNRAISNGTYKLIKGINDGSTSNDPGVAVYLQYPDVKTATDAGRLYKLTTDWREETDLAPTMTGADLAAYNELDEAMADLLASDGL